MPLLRQTSRSLLPIALLLAALAQACSSGPSAAPVSPEPQRPFVDDEEGRTEAMRRYYGGEASYDYLKFKSGVAQSELRRATQALTRATPAWTNLGPFAGAYQAGSDPQATTAGRLTAIVVHPTNPQIVYVATAGGGVFKSTNADVNATSDWTWTPITDGLPASSAGGEIAVGAMAMSPTDPNTLFIGMGDPYFFGTKSLGFFVTHDGGATWSAGGALGGSTSSQKIVALDSNRVLVAASGGLFRSTDGGKTFTAAQINGGITINQATSVTLFANGNLVASGLTSKGGQIFYSTDKGATWSLSTITGNPVTTSDAQDYASVEAAASGTVGYALLANFNTLSNGVFKTTDSGKSFAFIKGTGFTYLPPSPPNAPAAQDTGQGMYNQMIAIDPADSTHLWIGTQLYLWRSFDGGATFAQASNWDTAFMHGDFHCAAWSKSGTKTLFIGNDGGLSLLRDTARSTTPALAWPNAGTADLTYADNRHNRGIASHLVFNIGSTFAPLVAGAHDRVAIGIQDDGVRFRTDTGQGLAGSGTFDETEGGDGFAVLFHPWLPDLVLGGYQNHLLRGTDGRSPVTVVMPPASNPSLVFPFNVFLHADLSDPSGYGVLTTGQSIVYRSHDFGNTFAALSQNGYPSDFWVYGAAVAPTAPDTVAMVGDFNGGFGAAFLSLDNGASWKQLGALGATARARFIWFDAHDANVLWVSSVQYDNTHHLWKSTDQGATFTAQDNGSNGLPNGIPIYVVKSDPVDGSVVYAGTDLGLYRSADGGATWVRYGSGLPLVAVRDLWISPDGAVVRVGTWGRGAWEIAGGRVPNSVTAAITSPAADGNVTLGVPVTLVGTVTSSGSGATTSGLWLFDDGTSATGLSTSHVFNGSAGTTSSVTFIGTDSSGANAGAVRTVTLQPASSDFSVTVRNAIGCGLPTCPFNQVQGSSGAGTVTVGLTGSPQPVTLSASGVPAGTTFSFNPTTVSSGQTSALTINVGATTAVGTWLVTVTGTGAAGTRVSTVKLVVSAPVSPIKNGDFESGTLAGWTQSGAASSVSATAHGGTYAAMLGATSATKGDSSISQSFVAPAAGGKLSFWYRVVCPDRVKYDWATAALADTTAGTSATVLAKTCTNSSTWKQVITTLSAGHAYTLTLTSHDDNVAGDPTYTLFDDVTVQ